MEEEEDQEKTGEISFSDIPLLEQSPEEQERQPDLGPVDNERVYLRPAAAAAYKTTLNETKRLCRDILSSEVAWEPVSYTEQGVLYQHQSTMTKCQVYIMRGHLTQDIPSERLLALFYKMPYNAKDSLVKPVKELETFEDEHMRVVQWETSQDVYPIFLSYLRGYKQVCGISVASYGDNCVTHRIIPSHRHQASKPNITDGFMHIQLQSKTTLIIVFGIPSPTPLDDFWMSKLESYLPYIELLNTNYTHYV
jgi:hypothetical protein